MFWFVMGRDSARVDYSSSYYTTRQRRRARVCSHTTFAQGRHIKKVAITAMRREVPEYLNRVDTRLCRLYIHHSCSSFTPNPPCADADGDDDDEQEQEQSKPHFLTYLAPSPECADLTLAGLVPVLEVGRMVSFRLADWLTTQHPSRCACKRKPSNHHIHRCFLGCFANFERKAKESLASAATLLTLTPL